MLRLNSRPQPGAPLSLDEISRRLTDWAQALRFQAIGVADVDLEREARPFRDWLAAGFAGEMTYLHRNIDKRRHPNQLVPGTVRVITARADYLDPGARPADQALADRTRAYVSRYALGRDYHKVLRRRLARLAQRIAAAAGPMGYRVFTDSAPVLEVALAQRAGLGWRGKHTLLLDREHGSWFFLGEIFTDLPLPITAPTSAHCGSCTACIDACPTGAIVAPYRLDARRCISYLTIELPGSIPLELRPLIGNRVYGCDDCQLACPWNRFARPAAEPDFAVRNGLDAASLVALFEWSENEFHARLAGSAIHRIGYERWLRNLAVGLGNAPPDPAAVRALEARANHPSDLVREHVAWALARQRSVAASAPANVGAN